MAALTLMTKALQMRTLRLMDFQHVIIGHLHLVGPGFESGSVNFKAHTITISFTASFLWMKVYPESLFYLFIFIYHLNLANFSELFLHLFIQHFLTIALHQAHCRPWEYKTEIFIMSYYRFF